MGSQKDSDQDKQSEFEALVNDRHKEDIMLNHLRCLHKFLNSCDC